jgi:hypothetical protein
MAVALVLSVPLARVCAGQSRYNAKTEKKVLKAQQKRDWKLLKTEQRNQKRSWKGKQISKATRVQAKHQMQRQKRDLRRAQRDARQDLKDRHRVMKERTKQLSFH